MNESIHIIHTADWHLGQTFFGYDRDAEQEAFLAWLTDTLVEQEADVLLIAGDIFDVANPSALAQRRFYHFLKEANRRNPGLQIVVIAGNHDSAVRLEAPNPLLEELNTTVVGLVRRTAEGAFDFGSLLYPLRTRKGDFRAWCLAVPYLRQGDYPAAEGEEDTYVAGIGRMYRRLREYAEAQRKGNEPLVAMGHLHAAGAERSDDDRSERTIMGGLEAVAVDLFDGLDYVALGHIHKAQRVGGRDTVRYAGSPLPMSFSETDYRHQLLSVRLDWEGGCKVNAIPVPIVAELRRIPRQPFPPSEVLEQLALLPDLDEKTVMERCPYIEVRVLLTEPEPGFRHRVEEALSGKAVRLASIVPSYPEREEEDLGGVPAYTDLQKIDPLDMLRHAFAAKYKGELPGELEELFINVIQEVSI